MSFRTGLNQFWTKTKNFGFRNGVGIYNAYTQGRQLAHLARTHLEKGTRFVEDVHGRAQQTDLLRDPRHKKTAETWTKNLRKFTDKYNEALDRADVAHDVLFPAGERDQFFLTIKVK